MLTAEEANKLSAGKMNSIYFREVEPLIRKACDIGDYSCMYPTKRKESFEKAMVELGYAIA